ncbi:MAG TPA: hypothetical protein VN213_08945, partial [Solirubrobacteraceae bacterium]|nr:hypothetical protein [Solirubrobacteraceae bacterium]
MLSLLASRLLAAAAALCLIPLVVWTLSGGPLELMSDAVSAARTDRRETPPRDGQASEEARRFTPARFLQGATRTLIEIAEAVARALALALACGLALGILRLHARRRRVIRRYWLLPYRADEGTPEALEALYRAWHEQLAVRWWQRLLWGQPALTLEIQTVSRGGDA